MDVVIAGGHGKIALLLSRILVDRGDTVRALIRNPAHADDVVAAGATPVQADLETEDDLIPALRGADAVVFAAGAGAGSGAGRKLTVDRDGALRVVEAAKGAGVGRYVMVSSMGAADPPDGDETFSVYLRAKRDADEGLKASGLEYTIVRPGILTDDPGTGRVLAAAEAGRAEIPRADVAATLAAVLVAPNVANTTFELRGGDTPIEAAVAGLGS